MKQAKLLFFLIAALAFAFCSSDEPRYVDPEAHEKTVQLNEQYGQLMVGTWHCESISDTQRYFEQLTFNTDGTLTGMRKWQTRESRGQVIDLMDQGDGSLNTGGQERYVIDLFPKDENRKRKSLRLPFLRVWPGSH